MNSNHPYMHLPLATYPVWVVATDQDAIQTEKSSALTIARDCVVEGVLLQGLGIIG